MSTTHDAAEAARQVKIARMIAALDADRQRSGHSWGDVVELLDGCAGNPAVEQAFWLRVAAEAGTRPPSLRTCQLARVHVDTLARVADDPFAGLTAIGVTR